jgi:hypothetical protein
MTETFTLQLPLIGIRMNAMVDVYGRNRSVQRFLNLVESVQKRSGVSTAAVSHDIGVHGGKRPENLQQTLCAECQGTIAH